jgi:cell division septal protein FtsQ
LPEVRSPRRRSERKTNQPKPRSPRREARRRVRWPILFASLTIALVGLGTYWLLNSPWLTVQEVRVLGTDTLDTASVAQISGLHGQSLLTPGFDTAKRRLLELPQVRSVWIERQWPQAVVIRVEERVPWGYWHVGGRDYPVDREGFVLAAGAPSSTVPRIVEPGSNRVMGPGDRVDPDAIAFAERIGIESHQSLGRTVRELEYRPGVGVTVVFEGGLRATFGDDRAFEYKMAVLSRLLDELNRQGIRPNGVDLRFGARATFE